MNSKQFNFWQKWLTYANVMTIIVGLLVAFAGNSIFFEMHNESSTELFFKSNEFAPEVLKFKNWLFGIIGGTIAGFHVLMVFISENSFKRKERWAYWALWAAMISWFMIDSGISYYYGAIHNILLINLVAMVLIGLPLIMTRKAFARN